MICFALITLLFLDFTGTLHGWFGWLAKIQFLPAVLALNVGVILFLVILTLVCGRIYCSVICPLGVFQDILAWLDDEWTVVTMDGSLSAHHPAMPHLHVPD